MTNNPASPKLLPCPFCGGTDIRFTEHRNVASPTGVIVSMCCYQCGATFPNRYKESIMVGQWNRREKAAPIEAIQSDTMPVDGHDWKKAFQKRNADYQKLVKLLGPMVEALQQAVKSCRCRGTGKYETSCSMCGDSTWDHMCDDEERPCNTAWCINARAVIESNTAEQIRDLLKGME